MGNVDHTQINIRVLTLFTGNNPSIRPLLPLQAVTTNGNVDVEQIPAGIWSPMVLPPGSSGVRVTDGTNAGEATIPANTRGDATLAIAVIVRTGVSGWWVFGAERRPSVSDINVMILGPILSQCPNISGTWSSSTETNVYNIYQNGCFITAEYEVRNITNEIHGFATEGGFAYIMMSTYKNGCTVAFFGRMTDIQQDKHNSQIYGSSGDCGYARDVAETGFAMRKTI